MASVLIILFTLSYVAWKWLTATQYNDARDVVYGTPPALLNHRPWGLDRIEQILRAHSECRLMELYLFHCRRLGSTVKQVFLGTVTIGTIEPRNLEAILSTNFHDWSIGERSKLMTPLVGDGIFTQEGHTWKLSRHSLKPFFTRRQYENLQALHEPMKDLLSVLPNKGIVDLQPYLYRYTLDVMTIFLLGDSAKSLREPLLNDCDGFTRAFDLAQDFIAQRLRLQSLCWLVRDSRFRKSCKTVHDFVDLLIERHLSRNPDEKSSQITLIDDLARTDYDKPILRDHILNLLVAGRDTTASMICWTLFLLVRHPETLRKLRAEIDSFDQNTSITRQHLRSMRYLQNVLNETLRLYPPVPINARTAKCDTHLPTGGGPNLDQPIFISKGTVVAYPIYSMHRRPDLFGMDAEIFRPERWQDIMPYTASTKWAYLPFSGGPRACLGQDLGMTEAAYTVVRLLQHFPYIRLDPGTIVHRVGAEKQSMRLVMSITEGCVVNLG